MLDTCWIFAGFMLRESWKMLTHINMNGLLIRVIKNDSDKLRCNHHRTHNCHHKFGYMIWSDICGRSQSLWKKKRDHESKFRGEQKAKEFFFPFRFLCFSPFVYDFLEPHRWCWGALVWVFMLHGLTFCGFTMKLLFVSRRNWMWKVIQESNFSKCFPVDWHFVVFEGEQSEHSNWKGVESLTWVVWRSMHDFEKEFSSSSAIW